MFYAITEAFNTLRDFMSSGGSVLWLIAILAGFMWAIILERIWYFNAGHKVYMQDIRSEWEAISIIVFKNDSTASALVLLTPAYTRGNSRMQAPVLG